MSLIIFLIIFGSQQECLLYQSASVLKRKYKNVFEPSEALISSRKNNDLNYGNDGSCLRHEIYQITSHGGQAACQKGSQITVRLMQKYYLNSFKIWFWDRGNKEGLGDVFYNIIIYTKIGFSQNKIYQNTKATSLVSFNFPDQFVEEFIIQNVNGNNYSENISVLKVQAYYQQK